MNGTILTLGVFGGVWLATWTIFSQFICFPNAKAGRVLQGGGQSKNLEATIHSMFVAPISRFIFRFVRLEEYHKETLEQTLSTAGIDSTAERYTANAIADAIMVFLLCVPFGIIISPMVILVAVIIAVVRYRKKSERRRKLWRKSNSKSVKYEIKRIISEYISFRYCFKKIILGLLFILLKQKITSIK